VTIELYTWTTPNGRKISIALEELGLDYSVHPINITKDEQFAPDFLKISPNNKIPAIIDPEGPDGKPISLFESGAILLYLADKTGRLMLGQAHHFRRFAKEQVPYAIERYTNETRRLYGVLDKHLQEAEYLAGDYGIADMATFPWAARHEWHGIALEDFPSVKRWYDAIAARPAVQKGMAVPG